MDDVPLNIIYLLPTLLHYFLFFFGGGGEGERGITVPTYIYYGEKFAENFRAEIKLRQYTSANRKAAMKCKAAVRGKIVIKILTKNEFLEIISLREVIKGNRQRQTQRPQ